MRDLNLKATGRIEYGPEIGDDDIARLEKLMKYTLPQDYSKFLRLNNPAFCKVPLRSNKPFLIVQRWFPLSMNDEAESTLFSALDGMREYVPDGVIAIAEDYGDHAILLDLRPKTRGTIYWWDYYVSGPESMSKVLFRSFSKMFAALEWDEDES